jgi:hypothetical protein
MDNTYGAGEADETESTDREAERQYQEYKREKLWAKEERQKRARRVEEQRQRREADGTEITDQEQKEADDAEDDYYSSDPQWAMIRRRHEAIRKLVEQARQESGMHGNESLVYVVAAAGIIPILGRVIIKNNKGEVAYIMSNEGHPTQWVSVNPDMGTRDGGEYETTTQSNQDIDAPTVHSKPWARRKSWDAGPPPADTDASDKTRATGQPTADIDAAPTHSTHAHITHTHMQDARKAAEGHVHPLTPTPRQTQIILPSPMLHTRAAERAALAASEP